MRATDAVSRPVYFAAVPAAWAGTLAFRAPDAGYADAYRLTLTQAVAFGSFAGLKRVIRRPRPFRGTPGVVSRSDRYYAGRPDVSYSMPSGHATLAAALATSWSLSHPRWFVVAPSALWAGSTSLSRVWLGVHYPSDVVAGTLLGAGVGVLVHVLGPHVTPAFLEADDDTAPPPMMSMTIRF
jgi:membrane-associated phospholipid phosphatase